MRIHIDIDVSWCSFKYAIKNWIARHRNRRKGRPTLSFDELAVITNKYWNGTGGIYFGDSILLQHIKAAAAHERKKIEVGG